MPTLFGPNMNKHYSTVATSRKHWEQSKIKAGKGVNTKVFMLNYGPAIDKALKVIDAIVADCKRHGGISDAHVTRFDDEVKKVRVISDKYSKICKEKARSDAANAAAWTELSKATTNIDGRFTAVADAFRQAAGHAAQNPVGPAARAAARAAQRR